ncbi:Na(+)/H(+) antiporter subunit B [Bacillus suaedaesalsae]|uniref:Na(+)/H(+) antiporter subunit B n=1 Tax=Bacillus suaedaesalsae TaxID=2810349 RepID=A0ABS2DIL7_9BACI|nr:Na(+)/H(+) antiporter subunit B [Bacillus suaedaesalsae]
MRTNDLILKTTTNIIVFIILAFSFKLFLAGHNMPGGGFIGGLMTAGALILMYITYGIAPIKKMTRISFIFLIGLGLAIAVATGIGSFFFDQPFLSHTDDYFYLPILGKTHLATAVLFDIGVYLTVVGVTMTIILSIAEDRSE